LTGLLLLPVLAFAVSAATAGVERLREPTHALEDPRHDRMPLFLNLRALKPA
jgi:hypothetical protein